MGRCACSVLCPMKALPHCHFHFHLRCRCSPSELSLFSGSGTSRVVMSGMGTKRARQARQARQGGLPCAKILSLFVAETPAAQGTNQAVAPRAIDPEGRASAKEKPGS